MCHVRGRMGAACTVSSHWPALKVTSGWIDMLQCWCWVQLVVVSKLPASSAAAMRREWGWTRCPGTTFSRPGHR
jgi:hypothetical protein